MSWFAGLLRFDHPDAKLELYPRDDRLSAGSPVRNAADAAAREAPLSVAFAGRLDNRDELATLAGVKANETADATLVLAAYKRFGEQCPGHLVGDFAFALWDEREELLLCVRDPVGVVPLYYFAGSRLFAFASRLNALLAIAGVPRRLDELRVAEFLVRLNEDKQRTFYRDLLRLPPGHALSLVDRRPQLRCYWTPRAGVLQLPSDAAYAEAFGSVLDQAVRCRLRVASGQLGAMLSGGLDSSSVVCLARLALAGRPLHCFSAVFPSAPPAELRAIDEREYIAAVVAQGGLVAHELAADKLSPLMQLEAQLDAQGEPIDAPNLYLHLAAYERAARLGISAVLDGTGGDDVVSHGIELLFCLLLTARWRRLWDEAAALAKRHSTTPARLIWQLLLRPHVPSALLWLRGMAQPHKLALDRAKLIAPQLARETGIRERLARSARRRLPLDPRARQAEGLRSGLLPYGLEVTHRAAAAFDIAPLYPFLDRRVIELCLALPPEQKLHDGWDRVVMRRALEGLLPPTVQWRARKAHLGSNFLRQLWHRERTRIEETVRDEAGVLSPFLDLPRLRACYARYSAAPLRAGDEAQALFAVTLLSAWLARGGPAMRTAMPSEDTD